MTQLVKRMCRYWHILLQSLHRCMAHLVYMWSPFEQTLSPTMACIESHLRPEWKKAEREIIKHSDCLVCYVYPDLRGSFQDMYEFAKHEPKLTMINAADPETATAVKDAVAKLETMQQYIIYALWAGRSYSCIAEALRVSGTSIHNKDSKARKLLREYAGERFKARQAPTALPSCAIVLPGKMEEEERQFRQVVKFLNLQMGVSRFPLELVERVRRSTWGIFHLQERRLRRPVAPQTNWQTQKAKGI